MITKEECLNALEKLKNYVCYDNVYELVTFKRLINEHFDNPPLKFEELKIGMWIWDNKFKVYNCIKTKYKNILPNLNGIQFKHKNESTQFGYIVEFEENRFYRKHVE